MRRPDRREAGRRLRRHLPTRQRSFLGIRRPNLPKAERCGPHGAEPQARALPRISIDADDVDPHGRTWSPERQEDGGGGPEQGGQGQERVRRGRTPRTRRSRPIYAPSRASAACARTPMPRRWPTSSSGRASSRRSIGRSAGRVVRGRSGAVRHAHHRRAHAGARTGGRLAWRMHGGGQGGGCATGDARCSRSASSPTASGLQAPGRDRAAGARRVRSARAGTRTGRARDRTR